MNASGEYGDDFTHLMSILNEIGKGREEVRQSGSKQVSLN